MLCLQQKMALRYRAIHNKWGCPLGLLRFFLEPSLGPWLRSVFGDSFFGDVLSLWWMIKICMSPQPNSWCCRGDGGMLWNHAYVFNHQVSSSCLIVKSSCIIHKWAMFQTVKYPEGESSTPSSSPQWLQSIPLPVDDYTNYTGRGVILPSKNAFEHCSLSLETMCFFYFSGGCPAKAVKGNCNKTRPNWVLRRFRRYDIFSRRLITTNRRMRLRIISWRFTALIHNYSLSFWGLVSTDHPYLVRHWVNEMVLFKTDRFTRSGFWKTPKPTVFVHNWFINIIIRGE